MRKIIFFLLICFATQAQIVNIPDANFKNFLINTNCISTNSITIDDDFDYLNSYGNANYYTDADTNNDGEIQNIEAESVTYLYLKSNFQCNPCDMFTSLQGLESFTNLKVLIIGSLSGIQTLNINNILPNLQFIKVVQLNNYQTANELPCTTVAFKNLQSLKFVDFEGTRQLKNIEISNNPNILKINYYPTYYNSLGLDSAIINNLSSLKYLNLTSQISSGIDLSSLNSQELECFISSSNLPSILFPTVAKKIEIYVNPSLLNFSNMTYLKELKTSINNYNSSINTINYGNIASTLEKLSLTTSNITANTNLFSFNGLTNLKELYLFGGAINSNLLFNNIPNLQILNLNNFRFLNENNLDFSPLINLNDLSIVGNHNTSNSNVPLSLNFNGLINLNKLNIDCDLQISQVNLSTLTNINELTIVGTEGNNVNSTTFNFGNLSSANKIYISGNNSPITINNNLNVSESFKVLYNDATIYNVPICNLVFNNQINTPLLELKGINPVFINSTNVIGYLKLIISYASNYGSILNLNNVKINKFDLSYQSTYSSSYGATNSKILFSEYTDIVEFNLTSQLNHVYATDFSLLTEIDLNSQKNLSKLSIQMSNGKLKNLLLKNGKNIYQTIQINANNILKYICVDDNLEAQQIQTNITPSLALNSNDYCTFVPGNIFYNIQGNNKWDINNNGCETNDPIFPNLKYNISNGITTNSIISKNTGDFNLSLIEGTHTITPQLENPTYFNVSPSNLQVAFPSTTSPFTQNFCITPNGIHHDVEVTLIPITPARPGFDATYKMIYKNKGNQIENGTVTLTYLNQDALDIVSCNPAFNSENSDGFEKTLTWNYVNLQPFQTREITVVLNLNGPMETPALNIGETLSMTSTVTPVTNDENPIDNSSSIRQVIVGSYDPNDKKCIEGTTITPAMVGEYVHYVIRFENTGTYPAQNVVVKDMIDLSKFDIATLLPIKASHNFETRIAGNKVEFIFENINLPFDDANNDGYVAFKIKTKPTLVLGDTFSNQANIYFDYNFPIITNTATTTIAALSTTDFDFGTHFTLYPNPVKDVLHFQSKDNTSIHSIEIYTTLGQVVLAVTDTLSTVDVSSLQAGNYIVKVHTDLGVSNTKFIKE